MITTLSTFVALGGDEVHPAHRTVPGRWEHAGNQLLAGTASWSLDFRSVLLVSDALAICDAEEP